HGVQLAPASRLMELEQIGSKFSGQGPALLTEYESYGARHFLRGLAAQTTSGLRVDQIYLRTTGEGAVAYTSPVVDEIRLDQLTPDFLTLTMRRTGVASRPPSAYRLRWSGRYYDVWQLKPNPPKIITHLALGSRLQPAAVPNCNDVMQLAHRAAR